MVGRISNWPCTILVILAIADFPNHLYTICNKNNLQLPFAIFLVDIQQANLPNIIHELGLSEVPCEVSAAVSLSLTLRRFSAFHFELLLRLSCRAAHYVSEHVLKMETTQIQRVLINQHNNHNLEAPRLKSFFIQIRPDVTSIKVLILDKVSFLSLHSHLLLVRFPSYARKNQLFARYLLTFCYSIG